MRPNRSMPSCTVIPSLPYPEVALAVDWLREVFGFTLRLRIGEHRAQLNVEDGAVVITQQDNPDSQGYTSVMVRVEDVNAHYDRALRHGASILSPPKDYPYGERQYTVEDCAGHRWHFSETIADVDPGTWGGTTE